MLDEILKLLHPFMPFITEELWRVTAEQGRDRDHCWRSMPGRIHDGLDDAAAEAEIGWVIDLVAAIRSVRAEMNIPPGDAVAAGTGRRFGRDARARRRWSEFVQRLARLSDVSFADTAPQGAVQLVVRGEVAALPLKGVIDLAAERARLAKEMAKCDADIARVDAKLGNADFLDARARGGGRRRAREARRGAGAQGQDRRGAGAAERRGLILSFSPKHKPAPALERIEASA